MYTAVHVLGTAMMMQRAKAVHVTARIPRTFNQKDRSLIQHQLVTQFVLVDVPEHRLSIAALPRLHATLHFYALSVIAIHRLAYAMMIILLELLDR